MASVDGSSGQALSAGRVARNDALFRAANERIDEAAEKNAVLQGIPFICECADPRCTAILPLSQVEYQEVRSNPRWFLNASGHDAAGGKWVRVVEEREGWVLVEKVGRAGEIVEQLDSRDEANQRRGEHGRA
jgi:hypothetical protein